MSPVTSVPAETGSVRREVCAALYRGCGVWTQTGWLKTMETHPLTFRGQRHETAVGVPGSCGSLPGRPCLCGSWRLPAIRGLPFLLLHSCSFCLHLSRLSSPCVSLCVFVSFTKDSSQWISAHPIPVWPHVSSQRPYFQIMSGSEVLGRRGFENTVCHSIIAIVTH